MSLNQSQPLSPPESPGPQFLSLDTITAQPPPPSNSTRTYPNGSMSHQPKETQGNTEDLKSKTHDESRRVLILCFDGTGNKFGQNSNIVRFFRALDKSKPGKQIVYYQPGIGTYNKHEFITHTMTTMTSTIDQAFAIGLNDHVKEGYQFVVQNYRPGDKICLFGFSRGAHTARVVAGMIYKVGILPKENFQQVDFAFNIYGTTGYQGFKLSHEFKTTFTPVTNPPLSADFVGVWDTVSSVGLIPRGHPYTSVNYAVKTFRHALALDERRARFRPNVWSEITLDREQDLDVDIPIPQPEMKGKRDKWEYTPPDRDFADVKEVWFAGTHADVGGGSHSTSLPNSLSSIPLRWMIKECILSETGIIFDLRYLRDTLKFDFDELREEILKTGNNIKLDDHYKDLDKYADKSAELKKNGGFKVRHAEERETTKGRLKHHFSDIRAQVYDQLVMFWYFWWILELIPMLYTYQDNEGNWIRRRVRNFGRGRYIPVYKGKVLVHKSVEDRMELDLQGNLGDKIYKMIVGYLASIMVLVMGDQKKPNNDRRGYRPKAHNWDYLKEHGKLEYVQ